jgi:hypothetical protein
MPIASTLTPEEKAICGVAAVPVEAAQFLKEFTGSPIQLLNIDTYTARQRGYKGVYSYKPCDVSDDFILRNQDQLRQQGLFLYVSEFDFIEDQWSDQLCMVSFTVSDIELIEAYEVAWPNSQITTQKVVSMYQEWQRSFGLELVRITWDSIAARVTSGKADIRQMATEVYELNQTGQNHDRTIDEMEVHIRQFNTVILWWD